MLRRRRTERTPNSSTSFLVVGLGNFGQKYDGTRHNVGTDTVHALVERYGVRLRKSKELAISAEVKATGGSLVLAIPQMYMNESGLAVHRLMHRYNIEDFNNLIVIHDELDLPTGIIKIKIDGGLAGHNGLKSIESHLHTRAFARVRIGIGPVNDGVKGRDYVLSRPSKEEKYKLDQAISNSADAIEFILSEGYAAAMNKFNA
ncbi:MAG: aminoacyl-tRNA hydrolase [Acidimicrobiales bacterium]|nr:aminoacyl-tRNA hydrolase [Acidimicrobiales bacterium]MDG1845267.1 aminoacyl-tRNA hydrolase [Acidimicrobiales bacterium]